MPLPLLSGTLFAFPPPSASVCAPRGITGVHLVGRRDYGRERRPEQRWQSRPRQGSVAGRDLLVQGIAPLTRPGDLKIATAGWAIPRGLADQFPGKGAGLTRYADRVHAVEINATFYRRHRPETFARWAAETPADFRFAIKAPRQITHEARLADCGESLRAFFDDLAPLGDKLGAILVQLPPSLKFDPVPASTFLEDLRAVYPGRVACEPRHATWFESEADTLLNAHQVAPVAADPAKPPQAELPGGWRGFSYWRLHGSPRMYYSPYSDQQLENLAGHVKRTAAPAWCVFDNTASGAAAQDALRLRALVDAGRHQFEIP